MSVGKSRGNAGEEYVCSYLSERGWTIAARNFRVRGGEIDIIAEKDGIIAFVEVKTRKFGSLDNGIDAVDRNKRRFIIRAADRYLEHDPPGDMTVRFDVAAVEVTTEELPRVIGMRYYENAFDAFTDN
ncbi:MAG: YraN family protein [Ruminiclostridium sp.]|nr:YraN family protein [Ruminiclostridium sp.]